MYIEFPLPFSQAPEPWGPVLQTECPLRSRADASSSYYYDTYYMCVCVHIYIYIYRHTCMYT